MGCTGRKLQLSGRRVQLSGRRLYLRQQRGIGAGYVQKAAVEQS